MEFSCWFGDTPRCTQCSLWCLDMFPQLSQWLPWYCWTSHPRFKLVWRPVGMSFYGLIISSNWHFSVVTPHPLRNSWRLPVTEIHFVDDVDGALNLLSQSQLMDWRLWSVSVNHDRIRKYNYVLYHSTLGPGQGWGSLKVWHTKLEDCSGWMRSGWEWYGYMWKWQPAGIEREDNCFRGPPGMVGYLINTPFTVDHLDEASGKSEISFSFKFTTYSLDTALEEGGDGMDCSHLVGWFSVLHHRANCALVVVYISISLREEVSEFRSIERFSTVDTIQQTSWIMWADSVVPVLETYCLQVWALSLSWSHLRHHHIWSSLISSQGATNANVPTTCISISLAWIHFCSVRYKER